MDEDDTNTLLIMRHAEAAGGVPDAERRLTPRGAQQAEQMAAWLAGRVEQGELAGLRLLASPYRRAQQTAQAVGRALNVTVETLGLITPEDDPREVNEWLLAQPERRTWLLVSHMPLVGELSGLMLEGRLGCGPGFSPAAIAELKADVWASGCATLAGFFQPELR
ncbi:phosphohistidine phosphatase SixA [Vreelandella rituensis]|uniref:Phosphohistidine phosphatase SixA n=2 Tax=Vreelandella rituensis TaxID=2282306 RepID=A0A368U5V4_9GAMM|nr:phosphohistidine phosphatase SixA [Halomonas rituensis]